MSNTFIQTIDGAMVQIYSIVVLVEIIVKQYLINLNFAKGNVLEDKNQENIKYRSLESKAIDWTEVIKNQHGKELSKEEYEQIKKQPSAFNESLSKDKRYFQVVVKETLKTDFP